MNLRRLNALLVALMVAVVMMAQSEKKYDFVVAQDGSGDFKTVQEAIDAVPDYRKERTVIFIKNGTYKEKVVVAESKQRVTIIGESVEGVVLTYDDYAGTKNIFGETKGTSGSSSWYIYGPDFHAKNVTFENSAGPVGQAVAIHVTGDRSIFIGCRFLGYQDTLYTYGKQSRQLYRNCYIEGTVDFIFGSSTAFFDRCHIHSLRRGYLTAASTPEGMKHGYVFNKCKVTAAEGVDGVLLGRPWRPYAQTVFVNCTMGNFISPTGWSNWGRESNEKTAFYAEVGTVDADGKPLDLSKRAAWSKTVKAEDYTIDKVLGDENADPSKPQWYEVEF